MQAIKEIKNNIGIIKLNKPESLNSLNREILEDINNNFDELIKDENIKLIILEGSGRAFSAGGDLNFLYKEILEKELSPKEFYHSELEIEKRFNNPKKPVISFMSGIIMGGGIGITIDTQIRVVDETTKWAMPETKIGIFPDIGIGYYFSKMKKDLALYLSLLGDSISGSDLINLGLADYYIKKQDIENIKEELFKSNFTNLENSEIIKKLQKIISNYSKSVEKTELDKKEELIKRYFDVNTLEEIFNRLSKDNTEISNKILKEMEYRSPLSLEITFQKYFVGKNWDRKTTIEYDLKLLDYCYKSGNLKEGIRALMIDKDLNPQWNPKTLSDVNKEEIKKIME